MRFAKFSLLAIFHLVFTTGHAQNLSIIDSLATTLIEKYGVKGIAVTGIKNGKTIYSKTFGNADDAGKLTTDTWLYIASNTKAFIGLAVAQLVEKKYVGLDDPVGKYLPQSLFADSIAVDSIKVRNLLAHTHGLSNDALTFRTAYSGNLPQNPGDLLQHTEYRKGKLNHDFRYSNLGYLIAGMIIEKVSGKTWQQFVEQNILEPLHMGNTVSSVPHTGNVALPYRFNNELLKIRKTNQTLHAAGGLFSTGNDMAKWLSYLADSSNGLIKNKTLYQLYHVPLCEVNQGMGPFKLESYSFGWINGSLFERPLRLHFGSFPGYESIMSYMPGKNTGVFVFVNEKEAGVRIAGMLTAVYYSLQLDLPEVTDVVKSFNAQIEKIYSGYKPFDAALLHPDSLDIRPGQYVNNKYGLLTVERTNGSMNFKIGELASKAYKGKNENEILVEWTPGIIEHFYLENDRKTLRYGTFGDFVFLKELPN